MGRSCRIANCERTKTSSRFCANLWQAGMLYGRMRIGCTMCIAAPPPHPPPSLILFSILRETNFITVISNIEQSYHIDEQKYNLIGMKPKIWKNYAEFGSWTGNTFNPLALSSGALQGDRGSGGLYRLGYLPPLTSPSVEVSLREVTLKALVSSATPGRGKLPLN